MRFGVASNRRAVRFLVLSAGILSGGAQIASQRSPSASPPSPFEDAGRQAAPPTRPVKLTRAAAEAVIKEIQKDRADTQNWLRSEPTSYLAAIDRKAFEDKRTLTIGRAADADVRIDDPAIALHHLRVTVVGDQFRVQAIDRQATFRIDKEEARDAALGPAYIQIDRFKLRLSHQRFPAIIVFDPRSPRFKEYKGLKYFPVDLAWRYEIPLTPNPKPETIVIMSTLGHQRRALRVGWFDFMVGETAYRLEATRLIEPGVGENDVAIFFRDATSGKDTYSLGRYVDATKLANGRYIVDFNAAYNPACAFSPHYSCPIPPKANALEVLIRAGEMDSHYGSY